MAGIYIHIPFCKSKCSYCDFYSETSIFPDTSFVDSLLKELIQKKNYLLDPEISTIYFGGGTPTLLSSGQIDIILYKIYELFDVQSDCEITFEANPDDLSLDNLKKLKNTKITRLSIGIQSFDNLLLKFLKRRHTAEQSVNAVLDAKSVGFENISGDLIYSIPGMNGEIWRETLDIFFDLDFQHLSAYDLIYEEGTPLYNQKKTGKVRPENEYKSNEYFTLLIGETLKHGFRHYELSNFAKEGCISRHNSSYWKQISYIGVGPSAHSFNGNERQWNYSNIKKWKHGILENTVYFNKEILSVKDKFNEFLITGLRTDEGVNIKKIRSLFGEKYYNYLLNESKKLFDSKHLKMSNESLLLPTKSLFISDKIISELLLIKKI